MATSTPQTTPHLTRIGANSFIIRPSNRNGTAHRTAPTIIILGWLQAATKHVLKYIQYYQQHYPDSTILYIASTLPDWFYRTHAVQLARTIPVVNAIRAEENADGAARPVLVHVFSNGGAQQFCILCTAYMRYMGSPLAVRGVVFDSSPGRPHFRQLFALSQLMFRSMNMVMRILSQIVGTFVLGVMWCLTKAGIKSQLTSMRETLNSGYVAAVASRRLYICSSRDALVAIADVKDHVTEAMANGYDVTLLEFGDSEHVNHMTKYRDEYWKAVEDFWGLR